MAQAFTNAEMTPLAKVLNGVWMERVRQDEKWGEQNHPDGTAYPASRIERECYRNECNNNFADGKGTWRDILLEEVYEALAESDPAKLREELVQVAAVAVAWIEAIDRR